MKERSPETKGAYFNTQEVFHKRAQEGEVETKVVQAYTEVAHAAEVESSP